MVTVWTFSRVIAGGKVRHVMKIIPGNKEKSEGRTQVFGNDVDGNPNESTGKVKGLEVEEDTVERSAR